MKIQARCNKIVYVSAVHNRDLDHNLEFTKNSIHQNYASLLKARNANCWTVYRIVKFLAKSATVKQLRVFFDSVELSNHCKNHCIDILLGCDSVKVLKVLIENLRDGIADKHALVLDAFTHRSNITLYWLLYYGFPKPTCSFFHIDYYMTQGVREAKCETLLKFGVEITSTTPGFVYGLRSAQNRKWNAQDSVVMLLAILKRQKRICHGMRTMLGTALLETQWEACWQK